MSGIAPQPNKEELDKLPLEEVIPSIQRNDFQGAVKYIITRLVDEVIALKKITGNESDK